MSEKKKFSPLMNVRVLYVLEDKISKKKFPSACLFVCLSVCLAVRGLLLWTQ